MGMKLQYNLENIGNIDKASITIKPLTIIAGENSSGKTFVTKSLYTILNSVYQNHFFRHIFSIYDHFNYLIQHFISEIKKPASVDIAFEEYFYKNGDEAVNVLFHLRDCDFEKEEELVMNNMYVFLEFEEHIKTYFEERKKLKKFNTHKNLISEIIYYVDEFMNALKDRKKIVVDSIDDSLETGFKKNYQIRNLENLIHRGKNKSLKLSVDTIGEIEIDLKSKLNFNFFGKAVERVQQIENIVFFDSPVYIKIRKALETNKRNIVFRVKDEEKYLKGYPEYLDKLYDFVDKEYIDISDFSEISDEIQNIISGKLDVSKNGDINYTDKENNVIPLSLTAMGISNIGLIDLLLRNNVINKGSFLIMDEPEVHLHPEWQVILAQLLYKIAKSGANIIIATHSLDFLKAFENILKEENEVAENIIAVNKMPYIEEFSEKTELEKVGIVLDDLSRPFYKLYMQDI